MLEDFVLDVRSWVVTFWEARLGVWWRRGVGDVRFYRVAGLPGVLPGLRGLLDQDLRCVGRPTFRWCHLGFERIIFCSSRGSSIEKS